MTADRDNHSLPDKPSENDVWFRAVVDSSYDAIIGKRLDGTIISWNGAAEQIYGYSAEEAVGQHISLLVPLDRRDELNRIMTGLPQGRGLRGHETERVRKDGRRIEVSLTISPVHDSSGQVVGGSVLARDITETRRTERALRESRERLEVAVKAADIGLFRWDVEADKLTWDETMRAIFGLGAGQEVVSLDDFLALLHPEDRDGTQADVLRSMELATEYAREYRVIRPNGEVRWVAAKARPFYDDAGRPLYLTGACRDVTERRRTQEALTSALEQKELLLREINHRVKNSLQLASSLLQVQASSAASEELRVSLSEAGGRLVTVARVHERLYRGANVQVVELRDYLVHLCDDIKGSTAVAGSKLSTHVEDLALGADKAILLGLVVNELVTNAIKHAVPKGERCEVRVECRQTERGLILAVADTGRGLPPGFDPRNSDSFGMRLVNAFVRQLGGTLEVASSSRGTRFSVVVPEEPVR